MPRSSQNIGIHGFRCNTLALTNRLLRSEYSLFVISSQAIGIPVQFTVPRIFYYFCVQCPLLQSSRAPAVQRMVSGTILMGGLIFECQGEKRSFISMEASVKSNAYRSILQGSLVVGTVVSATTQGQLHLPPIVYRSAWMSFHFQVLIMHIFQSSKHSNHQVLATALRGTGPCQGLFAWRPPKHCLPYKYLLVLRSQKSDHNQIGHQSSICSNS